MKESENTAHETAEQETFVDAVLNDKKMSQKNKIHWLKVSADDYWQRLQTAEAALTAAEAEGANLKRRLEWRAKNLTTRDRDADLIDWSTVEDRWYRHSWITTTRGVPCHSVRSGCGR